MQKHGVMEKRKPTYDLASIKAAFSTPDQLTATGSAIRGAAALGYGRKEMVEAIQSTDRRHFYKSMTSYEDHRLWQDVYHVPFRGTPLYIKFTAGVLTEFVLLSFKEKNDG